MLKVRLDPQGHKEQLVLKVLQAHKVPSDRLVHKVPKVL